MSVEEMKINIKKSVDSLNEAQLKQVNHFIEKMNGQAVINTTLLQHIDEIFKERAEVLKKLAQ